MKILVTGGCGYIGSHTCLELLQAGYEVVVVDNLCNSSQESLTRVKKITGKELVFYEQNILDEVGLREVFAQNAFDAVIHFAGLKAVGESVNMPLEYYDNNIIGTLVLLRVMREFGVNNFVFSSSATVYGDPHVVPITEDFPLSVTNPYGRTKLMIEDICRDLFKSDNSYNIALLRYFNPVGAHKSGQIGEDPNGVPNNLVPFIAQVAIGRRTKLMVFGNDYNTIDGTGVRDYIHVVDLAVGHIRALEKLNDNAGLVTYNLGTGQGYSVLEMIHAFAEASKRQIPFEIVGRRTGDIASCYANPAYAETELGWKAKRGIQEMTEDAWRWQVNNPAGFN